MRHKFKRICSLIVTAALSLTCIGGIGVSAEKTEKADNADSYAVESIEGLGIADGIKKDSADSRVSREEFALMLVHIYGNRHNELGKQPIADIAGNENEAKIQNIIAGRLMLLYDDGNFKPDESVTWEMAIRAMMSLTGYDRTLPQDENGYVSGRRKARQLGILDSLTDGSGTIRYDELCRLIYNTLDISVLYSYTNGEDIKIGDTKETVLSYYLKLMRVRGIVKAVGRYAISGAKDADWGKIVIEDTAYTCDDSMYTDFLGYSVEGFCSNDGKKKLKSIVKSSDDQLKLEIDIDDVSYNEANRELSYTEDDGQYAKKMVIPADADILLNGSLITSSLKSVLDKSVCGTVTVIDGNSDGKADVFMIKRRDVRVVDSVNTVEEAIYVKKWQRNGGSSVNGTEKIVLKDKERVVVRDMQGYTRSLGDIKAWDVIEIEENAALETYSIFCPFETAMGIAETVYGNGIKQKVVIDGSEHKISPAYYTEYGQAEELTAGINYNIKLDSKGRVAAVIKNRIGKGLLGYVLDVYRNKSSFGGGEAKVRMLTEDGQIQMMSLAKGKVDEISADDGYEMATAVLNSFENLNASAGAEVAQLVIYEVNDKQEIVSVNTPYISTEEDAQSFRAIPLFGSYGFQDKLRRGDTIEGNYRIDSSAKVFIIPPGGREFVRSAGDYNFAVKSALSHLGDGGSAPIQAFKYTDGSYNLDVLVARQGGNASIDADTPIQLVKSVFKSMDADGNPTMGMDVITIDVYGGKNENTYYAAELDLFKNYSSGDVAQVVLNDKGVVTYIRPVIYLNDPTNGKHLELKKPVEPDDGQWNNYSEPSKVLLAGAYCREEESLIVNRGPKVLQSGAITPAKEMSVLAAEEADISRLSGFMSSTYVYPLDSMPNIFVYDESRKVFEPGDRNDIIDYKSDPANYSTMMMFTWWGGIRSIVIYK